MSAVADLAAQIASAIAAALPDVPVATAAEADALPEDAPAQIVVSWVGSAFDPVTISSPWRWLRSQFVVEAQCIGQGPDAATELLARAHAAVLAASDANRNADLGAIEPNGLTPTREALDARLSACAITYILPHAVPARGF